MTSPNAAPGELGDQAAFILSSAKDGCEGKLCPPNTICPCREIARAIIRLARTQAYEEMAKHLELEAERAGSMTQVAPASVSFALKDQALHFRAHARQLMEKANG